MLESCASRPILLVFLLQYLIELSLWCFPLVGCPPSAVAWAAVWLAMTTVGRAAGLAYFTDHPWVSSAPAFARTRGVVSFFSGVIKILTVLSGAVLSGLSESSEVGNYKKPESRARTANMAIGSLPHCAIYGERMVVYD